MAAGILKNFKFWIFLFFIIRMVGITNPPLEISHSWRQVTGLMVARNFLETDNNILYPRVDDNQGGTGIIGMEFPLLNYLVYLMSLPFGYEHWFGRLINLIVSSLGIYFFYQIVSRYFNEKTGFIAGLILLFSIWFSFSRKTMPDTFCISLMFIACHYGLQFLDKGKIINLGFYLLIGALAVLSKIPAGIYLSVLAIPLVSKGILPSRKAWISISTLLILAAVYWWYFEWNFYLSSEYGNWYNSGKEIATGFTEIVSNLSLASERFYFSAFKSYIMFPLFIAGIFLIFRNKQRLLVGTFLLVSMVFLIYILKAGFFFYHHNYYIIPFVPVMALLAAYTLSLIKKERLLYAVLFVGGIEAIANQQHDFFIKDSEAYKMKLERIADKISDRNKLIAINGESNPQQLYLTHRKGWSISNEALSDRDYIESIKRKGCNYIFINRHLFNTTLPEKIVYSDDDYIVYQL